MQRTARSERQIHIPGYQFLRCLNQSQFAATYLARQVNGERKVVLKVLARPRGQPDFNSRFVQGCELLGQLRHPNIARLYEGGVHSDVCYLALEYVSGAARLDELPQEGPGPVLQQLGYLARALQYANSKGINHGCIEGVQVVVGRERRVILTGFERQLLETAPLPVEPHYRPPEGLTGEAAGDIYSLGILLYSLLVWRNPTEMDFAVGQGLKHVVEGVPALPPNLFVLQPLINGCLAPEPEQRFSSVAMLADAIETIGDEEFEAIQIATPHYLASIESPPSVVETLTDIVEMPDTPQQPRVADRSPSPAEEPSPAPQRASRSWLVLGLVLLVLGGGMMLFRDRMPPPAELLARAESGAAATVEWLQRVKDSVREGELLQEPVLQVEAADDQLDVSERYEVSVPSPQDELPASDLGDGFELQETASPSLSVPSTAHQSSEDSLQASDYVEEGQRLLTADALTVPLEENALAAFQQALVLDPENTEAWAGLRSIVARYEALAETRMASGDLASAAEFIRRGLAVDANNPALLSLQSRLSAEVPASPEELERLSAMARVQMVRENYLAPEGDSAFDHYSRLLLMEPGNKEAISGLARIERELAREIELRVNRNRFDQARTLLVMARDAFPTSQRFHNLAVALEAAAQSERDARASIQHLPGRSIP